ncbi:hypothetical protein P171DRAFT_469387 [Karstenula rhodostoma CBS 690.94]|uniref:Uncharacterized protein n=1 Tax=Karstenula rhodostoma CBS 690.94 TaxID=1392251 RepID=A0A9P4UHI5_9PLEO|nr:hypothetical protein P171DRAFT_469387 [Karstenula rhodostoma CBS 690.94]
MMTRISRFATALGLATLKSRQDSEPGSSLCHSYGMDFQSNGQYFQNSLSSDNFTFVEQFEGCNADVAYNIIVDPEGTQNLCTDTSLTPDDTNMLSTCPLRKNQLVSGSWSIVVISDNGDGVPLAAQRDFILSVGPQSTSTITPAVTATRVINPLVNQTITTTTTGTTYLDPRTVTSPSATITPTTTVTPRKMTSYSTKALLTLRIPTYKFNIAKVTATKTASCKLPTRPTHFDRRAVIVPTVGPVAHIVDSIGLFRREEDRGRFLQERASRLALVGRAPDPQPLLVTEANTNKWSTATVTTTGTPIVATITSEVTTLATLTPPPVTVVSGQRTAKRVTVTAPTPTLTKTRYVIVTVGTTTKTVDYVYTINTTTTPSAVAEACKSAGGILY